ncbi:MAG: DNA mismatch repair protein MutS, partial [Thermoanaerobaculia bacterium]|nr:DNA mismatch repair protein MutS [Thermoanaerobaculia bacterium]
MTQTVALTPMLRHYLEVKADYPDAIVFYRMGDFFELFYEDAQTAAPILEVTLTARQKGTPSEAPMCGIPHHALEGYVGKLLQRGLKVAICDQVEDPKQAQGLVKREVTRVMTPGTLSEPALLDGQEDNFLVAIAATSAAGDKGGDGEGLLEDAAGAFLDVSTGSFFIRRWSSENEIEEDLELLRPREVIAADGSLPSAVRRWIERRSVSHSDLDPELILDGKAAESLLLRQLGVGTLKGFGLGRGDVAVRAAAMALTYAQDAQRSDLSHVKTLRVRNHSETLVLDPTTLANLEVLRSLREGGRKGSLLSILDKTRTSPGGRLLRDWLRRPLRSLEEIARRYDSVEVLLTRTGLRHRVREQLEGCADIERLASRAVLGTMTPREVGALRESLRRAPKILSELANDSSMLLAELAATDPLPKLLLDLESSLVDEPPASRRDGGVIATGVDAELDRCRSLARDSKQHILALEASERKATGISNLKIRYNKVFGYYLEVTKANQNLVPDHYIRKQTLVNAERYITPEVKELEEQV